MTPNRQELAKLLTDLPDNKVEITPEVHAVGGGRETWTLKVTVLIDPPPYEFKDDPYFVDQDEINRY